MRSRRTSCWRSCRRFSPRHLSPPSGPPSPPCTDRWWRRWNMSNQQRLIKNTRRSLFLFFALFVAWRYAGGGMAYAADDARTIVAEAQRRTDAKSQQYEGVLQVLDAKGKISDKRWTFKRLGSHGQARAVLRFIAPPEVKGVALLVVNHPDRPSDQWMWTPATERDRRIALQDRSTRFFGTDFTLQDLEGRAGGP